MGNRIDEVAVYMDDVHVGAEDALRTISANGIQRVAYINARDTTFRFGANHAAV